MIVEPKRDVFVREGRVDLVCEEAYTETFTFMKPLHGSSAAGASMSTVPKQVTKKRKGKYVHSSIVFLKDATLNPNSAKTHEVRLEIQPDPPPHAPDAEMRWTLVTTINVARARDIMARQTVEVKLLR